MKTETQYRPLKDLHKLEGNPRQIRDKQFQILVQSIKDNPDYFEARPIILSNRTGKLVIIAGNQRYEAAKVAGLKEVPTCLLEGLTLEREREIIIRDNISLGQFDMDILANEWEVEDLEAWGVELGMQKSIDEFDEEFNKYNNDNCEYPIVARYSEKYNAFVIISTNEIDEAFIKTVLNCGKEDSYKKEASAQTYVLTAEKFQKLWNAK